MKEQSRQAGGRKRRTTPQEKERKAAEKLSKPPKDRREITIAPSPGPDVSLE